MAKIKLDWFKLDCQLDDKMELIESEFGLIGFAVVVRLFQKIYGGEGYYCEWNEDVALVFAKRNSVGASAVSEIVSAAVKRGIFDEGMLAKFGILTSHGIQQRYFECVSRRKAEKIKPEYLLLNCAQISKDVDISSKNVYISEKNADIFSQKRIEENRREKKRVEERRDTRSTDRTQFFISDESRKKLIADYGKALAEQYIEKVKNHCQSKGKTYADYAATVRKWLDEDLSNGRIHKPKESSIDIGAWYRKAEEFEQLMGGGSK